MVPPVKIDKSSRYLVRIPGNSSPVPITTTPRCSILHREEEEEKEGVNPSNTSPAITTTAATTCVSVISRNTTDNTSNTRNPSTATGVSVRSRTTSEDNTSNTTTNVATSNTRNTTTPAAVTSVATTRVSIRPLRNTEEDNTSNTSATATAVSIPKALRRRTQERRLSSSGSTTHTTTTAAAMPTRSTRNKDSRTTSTTTDHSSNASTTTPLPFRSIRNRIPQLDTIAATRPRTHTKRKAYELDPQEDPDLERCRQNAINARRNRELKKARMAELERRLEEGDRERDRLMGENRELKEGMARLQRQVGHLTSVLRNDSRLSSILDKVSPARVSLGDPTGDKEEEGKDPPQGGVCLHLDGKEATLEFCSLCAKKASKKLRL